MATGLTLTSTSNLSTGQKRMVMAAREAFEPAAPDPGLVDQRQLPAGHFQMDLETFHRLDQAQQLTEASDLASAEQLASTALTVEPSEHGILVTLSRRLVRRQGDTEVAGLAGRQMGGSMKRREANDVIALYDGFSQSMCGTGNALDVQDFANSVAYLMTDNSENYGPAPMPYHAVLHAEQIRDIIIDISDTGTVSGARPAGFGDEILANWWRGSDRLYSIPIWHSGNISKSGSDAKGAIKSKGAIVEVEEGGVEAGEDKDLSGRLRELGIFKSWGEAEYADRWGVEIFSDATANT